MDVLIAISIFCLFMFLFAALLPSASRYKGRFTVKAYKNGELVYQEVYVNSALAVRPGDSWDRVEIVQ